MPITRVRLRDPEPDENGDYAHAVYGTDAPETYETQGGDREVRMAAGNDRVTVNDGFLDSYTDLTIWLGAGDDKITNRGGMGSGVGIHGGKGNDDIAVGAGDGVSVGWGDDGNDVMRSLGGDEGNYLYAGPGNDTLHAGPSPGGDELWGGPGVDRFFLHDEGNDTVHILQGHSGTAANSAKPDTRDHVFNFQAEAPADEPGEQDIIDLSRIDANPGADGDQAFTFIGHGAGKGPLQMGQAAWFYNHEAGPDDVAVAFVGAEGRRAIVLEDFAAEVGKLDAGDFWL